MKKCPTCNKHYGDDDTYCLRCNTRLIPADDSEVSEIEQQSIARHEHALSHPRSIKYVIPTTKLPEPKLIPTCPLCKSENIRHIKNTEKVGNTLLFGIFGNKRKQQFECLNPVCKYRW